MIKYVIIYLAVLNILGFFIMLIDKTKAKKKQFRIRESTIFLISIIGGSLGVYIGMHVFRHKTKHNKFIYGIAFILILHILFFAYIAYNYPQLIR